MKKYLMSFDQGTTSSRCIIFDKESNIISSSQKEITQIFPHPGYVEHDPMEILNTQIIVAKEAIEKSGLNFSDIAAIGITNQRETTIVWNKKTGKPIYNAIVWQCRRTSTYCNELKKQGLEQLIKSKTGLIIDAYFSAGKIKWILDNVLGAREMAKKGELLFGTVDTWLMWNLTGGKLHATDYSNASRTMLFNINTLSWDDELLSIFDIPYSMLPVVLPSSGLFANTSNSIFGAEIPISGVAGDQQSALFGQACFDNGDTKNTYGTGCFVLMNTGTKFHITNDPLITTIAWGINKTIYYALEGSIFSGGSVIQWLRDQMGFISSSAASELEALKVEDTDGVYLVPAFTGLGAPYWSQDARATISGMSRGTNRCHIVRAALESIAYQSYDVIRAIETAANIKLSSLYVDGGACTNDLLMQFQANILDADIFRPMCIESTALGAAYLAGLGIDYYESLDEILKIKNYSRIFKPNMSSEKRNRKLDGWHSAVKMTINKE